EAAVFVPTLRGGGHERHRPAAFLQAIQHAVRVTHRSLAETAFVPDQLPRPEILAHPAGVAVSIKVIADEDDAAVMILHHLVFVHDRHLVAGLDADLLAARPVAGAHIHLVAPDDGGRDDGGPARKGGLPKQGPVLGGDPDDTLF